MDFLPSITHETRTLIESLLRTLGEEIQHPDTSSHKIFDALFKAAGPFAESPECHMFRFSILPTYPKAAQELVNAARKGHAGAQIALLKNAGDYHRLEYISDITRQDLINCEAVLDKITLLHNEQHNRISNYAHCFNRTDAYDRVCMIQKIELPDRKYQEDIIQIYTNPISSYLLAKRLFDAIKHSSDTAEVRDLHGEMTYWQKLPGYYNAYSFVQFLNIETSNISFGQSLAEWEMLVWKY